MSGNQNSRTPIVAIILGVIFTVTWVLVSSMAFVTITGLANNGFVSDPQNQSFISTLIWPFVAVSLGVPVIVFVWFGGFSALSRLRELRSHLENLDAYVRDFEAMASKARTISDNFRETKQLIIDSEDAASQSEDSLGFRLDKITSQLNALAEKSDDWVCKFRDMQSGLAATTEPTDEYYDENPEIVFNEAYQLAIDVFRDYLNERNAAPGKGRRILSLSRGGWNKLEVLEKLLEEEKIPQAIYDPIHWIFDIENTTRRWGRDGLDPTEIRSVLNALENAIETSENE